MLMSVASSLDEVIVRKEPGSVTMLTGLSGNSTEIRMAQHASIDSVCCPKRSPVSESLHSENEPEWKV
jgi:hypothetical protein